LERGPTEGVPVSVCAEEAVQDDQRGT
jgi:hypothetical protein